MFLGIDDDAEQLDFWLAESRGEDESEAELLPLVSDSELVELVITA